MGATWVPLVWVARPVLTFADYPLRPVPSVAGTLYLVVGPWLFYRSHADLGTNWERLMLEEFGQDYVAHMARTRRLVPGIW